MHLKTAYLALAAVVLPSLDGLPSAPRDVQLAARALCEDSASASVAELAAVASYLADLAAIPELPDEVRMVLLVVRASLLGLRVRNHHPRTSGGSWTDCCRASSSGSGTVTATMQVQVR